MNENIESKEETKKERLAARAQRKNKKKLSKHSDYCINRGKEMRLKVLSHYSAGENKCSCCNESIEGFLTLDHINSDGAEHRRQISGKAGRAGHGSTRIVYEWAIKNDYPKGLQVLCYNCNCGRGMNNGVCPHKENI